MLSMKNEKKQNLDEILLSNKFVFFFDILFAVQNSKIRIFIALPRDYQALFDLFGNYLRLMIVNNLLTVEKC